METTGLEPATADNNALTDAPEVDSEVAEVSGAEPAPAAVDTGKPERDRVQERIDKLTREKYEGLSRAERAEYRAQLLEQQLAEREAKPQTVAPSNEFPTLESVGFDEQQYHKAVAEFYSNQARDSVKAELERERQAAQREKTHTEWSRRQNDFIKAKPDYMEKVGGLPPSLMTDSLAAEIKSSDMGPEVAYYLAENIEKLAAIAQLPASAQAREIGRIEARLEAAKTAPPPVSKAPPPPVKIDGSDSLKGVSTTDPDSDKLSDEDWFKAEKRRLSRKKG